MQFYKNDIISSYKERYNEFKSNRSLCDVEEYFDSEDEYLEDEDFTKQNARKSNPEFISVNDYLWENHINEQQFFLRHNDFSKMEFAYIYGLSNGLWCCACKCLAANCDCEFVCGLAKPTGQINKRGEYSQFKKCKWRTNNLDYVIHECKGVVVDSKVYRFENENANSFKLCEDFGMFEKFIKSYYK